jgi:hypothetical protein
MRSTTAEPAHVETSGSLVMGALRGWDRFWFSPGDPTTLAFIRICAGLVIFYVHLTYSWELLGYVGPEAWVDKNVSDFVRHRAPIFSVSPNWQDQPTQVAQGNYYWSIFYHVTNRGWIIAIHVFFLTVMVLMTVGLWTRYTTALTWLAAMSYVQRAQSTVFGLDTMMMIVLLYLTIGPSGAVLSVDSWWRRRKARQRGEEPEEPAPSISANFAIRLIQVHFCVIYFASGTSKLLGGSWWSGTALNVVMLNPSFAPMDFPPYFALMKFLSSHRWMWETFMALNILTTLFLEIGFPFLVWDPRWRWAMICGSVMLHTGIALFMGLTTFSLIMICMVSSFIPPEVIRQLATGLSERFATLFARKTAGAHPGDLVLSR